MELHRDNIERMIYENRIQDLEFAIKRIEAVVTDLGVQPDMHIRRIRTARLTWPLLWNALDDLIAVLHAPSHTPPPTPDGNESTPPSLAESAERQESLFDVLAEGRERLVTGDELEAILEDGLEQESFFDGQPPRWQ
jgi:hypothetical protein